MIEAIKKKSGKNQKQTGGGELIGGDNDWVSAGL